MKITIIQDDGVVGCDGVFREVALSDLDPAIHAIHFDTAKSVGHIEYDPGATVPVEVRDHEAEDAAWAAARGAGTPEAEITVPVLTKTVHVARLHQRLDDFAGYQQFIDRWAAAGEGR